ncbi:hypothetical protein [Hydrocarboniphaga effusa]|uniref:hypothetical protein n=1 Tax=Hydrocarboniphaga effusa TaxID=243629 RepID=UPI003BA8811C
MSRDKSQPQRPEASPLVTLAEAFVERFPDGADPWQIFAQLGIPVDARYLRDGLVRTNAILQSHGEDIDACLQQIEDSPLMSAVLQQAVTDLLTLVDERPGAFGDHCMAPMARISEQARHPLNNYCLGVLHYWSSLFYATPPERSGQAGAVEQVVADFAAYALAAHSLTGSKRYREYCAEWWRKRQLPDKPLIPNATVSSRLSGASLVIRRMSKPENAALLAHFSGDAGEDNFLERLRLAMGDEGLKRKHEAELNNLALLVESLLPNWRASSKRRRGTSGRLALRRSYIGDGFVRIDDGVVATESETEAGDRIQEMFLVAKPPATPTDEVDDDEWMPYGDGLLGSPLTTLVIDPDDPEYRRISEHPIRSRWVAEHIRRDHYAHRLPYTRLLPSEFHAILGYAQKVPSDVGLRKLILALVASLALGISLEDAHRIPITEVPPTDDAEGRQIRYRRDLRCWEIRVRPPAYVDEAVTPIERPIAEWLQLPDVVGFHNLLERYGIDGVDVKKLNAKKRRQLTAWLQDATGDTHATIAACGHYLFHRLLDENKGDVGSAFLLTGRSHSHARSVAHYAHYSHDRLVAWYLAALDCEDKAKTPLIILDSAGFGARRVPTYDAVSRLIATLKIMITNARAQNAMRTWRNAYTTYTLVGFAIALALRAIVDPHLRDLSDAFFATYSDKARTDYHRRVTALPPALIEQGRRYGEFRRVVDAHLGSRSIASDIAFAFERPDGSFEPYRPRHFIDITTDFFGLELYSLRRFARTALLEDPDTCGEDLDAWMGHWHDGVSPHDARSTYPSARLMRFALGPATKLLQKVGYDPMRALA